LVIIIDLYILQMTYCP